MKKIQFIIIPTILSFGLIISSALISNAIDKANKNENRITVKGVAERRIKADKALINIVISKKSESLDELKKEMLEREKIVTDLIKNLKISENEYSIGNLRIQPNYVENSSDIKQTSANSSAPVTSSEITNKISKFIKHKYKNIKRVLIHAEPVYDNDLVRCVFK